MVSLMGGTTTEQDVNACLDSEQKARDQIVKDRATYSATASHAAADAHRVAAPNPGSSPVSRRAQHPKREQIRSVSGVQRAIGLDFTNGSHSAAALNRPIVAHTFSAGASTTLLTNTFGIVNY